MLYELQMAPGEQQCSAKVLVPEGFSLPSNVFAEVVSFVGFLQSPAFTIQSYIIRIIEGSDYILFQIKSWNYRMVVLERTFLIKCNPVVAYVRKWFAQDPTVQTLALWKQLINRVYNV